MCILGCLGDSESERARESEGGGGIFYLQEKQMQIKYNHSNLCKCERRSWRENVGSRAAGMNRNVWLAPSFSQLGSDTV